MPSVSAQGLTLRIAEKPGNWMIENPLPAGSHLIDICYSTTHITSKDHSLLYALSHQAQEYSDVE